MTVYEFFDKVYSGELGDTDIYNFIEKITDKFDIKKLKNLKKDISYCYHCAYEEKIAEYSQDDIETAINERNARKMEIPYTHSKGMKNKNGEIVLPESKILNLEKLLFPYDFFTIYQLQFLIEKLIKENETEPTAPPPPQQPPQQMTFNELFKFPYNSNAKMEELKNILKKYKHIDSNNNWIGITNDKNELATLYWLFEEKQNILNPGKVTPQLKTFYKEFNLIVYTDKEQKGYCTIKNINKHPGETSTYKHFAKVFNDWITRI